MNRIILLVALPLLFVAGLAGTASAQTFTDCDAIQTWGNIFAGAYGDRLDAEVAGARYRISRLKTLEIHGVERASFEGCTANVDLDVTLHRRVRRDAHGTITARADVRLISLDQQARTVSVCVYNPRVSRIRVSHTTGLAEAFYRWVANMALPGGRCETFHY